MQDNQLMRQFKQAINQDDPDLLLACLTLAQGIAQPELDLVGTAARFNLLAEAAAARIDRQLGDVDQMQELCEFLFVDQGFQGEKEDYYDPLNSFLPILLDHSVCSFRSPHHSIVTALWKHLPCRGRCRTGYEMVWSVRRGASCAGGSRCAGSASRRGWT